jgi:hypothetical protein
MYRFLALLTVFLMACPSPVQINEALWKSRNIVNYEFTFRRLCFCPPEVVKPVVLEVRAGMLVGVRFADGSSGAVVAHYQRFAPLEKIFREIENVQRSGGSVTAMFDPTYGFPTNLSADPVPGTVDDEFVYTITDFKVL